jgi:hypothetical protein
MLAFTAAAQAALWQYRIPFEESVDRSGTPRRNYVSVWIPPECNTLRGLYISQTLGIEGELQVDPEVRRACAEAGIAILRCEGLGTFNYWTDSGAGPRLLAALDAVSKAAGHPEIRRVPWITAGHSTNGIFCRNVAYWKPERVAAVVHIKSGNFHQKDCMPPDATLAGVPLVAINGQLETYGPSTGIDPEWGRETQWIYVRKDLLKFREKDPNQLMSMAVHPGDDHFHGAPELGRYVAMFLRKTAQYRLPAELPPGNGPVSALPLKAESGWLSDSDLCNPKHPAAPYADYAGDKAKAFWHYDKETADATAAFHKNLGKHQAIDMPKGEWLDEGDGWTFRVKSEWLAVGPEKFGGKIAGQPLGHSPQPFVYRTKPSEPVVRIGPDTFRLLRQPVGKGAGTSICAFHPGDDTYRATSRWGGIAFPRVKGTKQTIDLPAVPDLKADAEGCTLAGKASSGLPVYYEVDYGPVVVEGNRLKVSEVPTKAQFPMACKITAYQIGRRTGDAVEPAPPVSVTFAVTKP